MKKILYIIILFAASQNIAAQATLNGSISQNGKTFRITTVYSANETAYQLIAIHEGNEYQTRFVPKADQGSIKIVSNNPSGQSEHIYNLSEINVDEAFNMNGLMARKTEETKTIAGISCKKVLAQTKNGNQAEIWVYENGFPIQKYQDIYKSDMAVQALSFLQIKGIPLEVHVSNAEGFTIFNFATREFSNEADNSFFK